MNGYVFIAKLKQRKNRERKREREVREDIEKDGKNLRKISLKREEEDTKKKGECKIKDQKKIKRNKVTLNKLEMKIIFQIQKK